MTALWSFHSAHVKAGTCTAVSSNLTQGSLFFASRFMDGRCLNSTAGSSCCCKLSEKAAAILGLSVNQGGLCLELSTSCELPDLDASDHQLPWQKVEKGEGHVCVDWVIRSSHVGTFR